MSDNRPTSDDPYATPSGSSPSGPAPTPGSAPSSANVSPYGGYEPPAGQSPYGAPQQPQQQPPYGAPQQPYGAQPQQQPYGQQPYGQPYPGQTYPAYGEVPDRSGNQLGVWSLVLAIVTFFTGCFPASIVGIVLGAKGRRAADEGRADNRGLATTGWVLNIVFTILTVLFIVALFVLVAALGGWEAFLEGWETGWEAELGANAV